MLLETRRHVDGIAAHHQFATRRGLSARDDVARIDGDAQPHLRTEPLEDVGCERPETLVDRERRADTAFRVVLVRLRNAEDGEDSIPDELLHHAAEPLDLRPDELEELSLEHAHVLRVERRPERRRAREVGEEDGHDPPFLALVTTGRAPRTLLQRHPACRAERRSRLLLRPAAGTQPLQRRATLAAETAPVLGLGAT